MSLSILAFIFSVILFVLLFLYLSGLIVLAKDLKTNSQANSTYLPPISIIVSLHNEQNNAESCILRLLGQDYPTDKLEIILVNDRSKDKTLEIIKSYALQNPQIIMLSIDNQLPDFAPKKRAIDKAIRLAKGDIILLTDADGRPQPSWARTMVAYFSEQVGMVIGYAPYMTHAPYDHLVHKLLALEYFTHAAIAAASATIGYPVTCVGTNMAYRKIVYTQLGGFGKFKQFPSGDDDLFLQQVHEKTNWQIVYATAPAAHVANAPPLTWKKFYNQRLRYASKGFFYSWKLILSLSLFYFLNLQLILFPFLLLCTINVSYLLVLAFFIKATGELFFLHRAANFLNDKRHLRYYSLAFFLHPLYVVYFGLMSQLTPFEWAGSRRK